MGTADSGAGLGWIRDVELPRSLEELAGDCAVIVYGLVDRPTRDVDLFTERNAGEALELCAALRAVLAEDGLRIELAADKTLALWGRAEPRDSSM